MTSSYCPFWALASCQGLHALEAANGTSEEASKVRWSSDPSGTSLPGFQIINILIQGFLQWVLYVEMQSNLVGHYRTDRRTMIDHFEAGCTEINEHHHAKFFL